LTQLDAGMHPAKDGFSALPFFDEFDLGSVDILLISQYVKYILPLPNCFTLLPMPLLCARSEEMFSLKWKLRMGSPLNHKSNALGGVESLFSSDLGTVIFGCISEIKCNVFLSEPCLLRTHSCIFTASRRL
jgi:hypothetical protein